MASSPWLGTQPGSLSVSERSYLNSGVMSTVFTRPCIIQLIDKLDKSLGMRPVESQRHGFLWSFFKEHMCTLYCYQTLLLRTPGNNLKEHSCQAADTDTCCVVLVPRAVAIFSNLLLSTASGGWILRSSSNLACTTFPRELGDCYSSTQCGRCL